MKEPIKSGWLVVLFFLLAGCATPYQKYKIFAGGGFQDKELEPRVYQVSFAHNGGTSWERYNAYMLYRCAEITIEHNCDFFAVISGRMKHGQPQSIEDAVTYLTTGTNSTPSHSIRGFAGPLIIRIFEGEKPPDYPEAVNAKEVIEQLKPRVMKAHWFWQDERPPDS
jgi:hypothetical protein